MKRILGRALVVAAVTGTLMIGPEPGTARAASLCYVNAAAGGTDDGSSWANAYTDLQSALTNSSCLEVWVAGGVYYPTSTTDQTVSFVVNPDVQVFGGFAGTESLLAQRKPGAHVTILSGDIDHNDTNLDGNNIDETVTDIQGNNSFHVVEMIDTLLAITSTTVLDGFTITGGVAFGSGNDGEGGGLLCNANGALGVCSPTLSNLRFSGNGAFDGGALMDEGLSGTSSPLITNVTFSGNVATFGGAVNNDGFAGDSSPVLTNVTFVGNGLSGSTTGGAMADYGGGLGNSSPFLYNVTFTGNAGQLGGAIYDEGTGGLSFPLFVNVILWGDSATSSGPEIANVSAAPDINHSVIQGSGGSGIGWDVSLGTDGGNNSDFDPQLGPISYNGGWNATVPFIANTSAFNTGNDGSCPATDQRGVPRPQGPHCDIGAFEHTQFVRTDFNGDRTSELAVFRPSTGVWYVRGGSNVTWGTSGDVPVPADYDGDAKVEVAVWRPSTGIWYIRGIGNSAWGSSGDVPVPGDYNGDGKIDVAVWRPSDGKWYVKGQFTTAWGQAGDIPVPGDYNGDGKTDLAVFRPSTGIWYIKGVGNFAWGTPGDIPVQADYTGGGFDSVAVWRASTGGWFVRGYTNFAWGVSSDVPVPAGYIGGGFDTVAVWRPSSGTWYVKSFFTAAWGAAGDYPLPAPDTNGNGSPYQ